MSDNRTWLINFLPNESICAEIGVWQGQFSSRILNETKPEKLYLIDPWIWKQPGIPFNCYIANTRICKNQADMDKLHKQVVANFAKFPQVEVRRLKSVEAAKQFEDEFFDWIYIDGSHDYNSVCADLKAWATKIKIGGFISGDDWDWGKGSQPVMKAVKEFEKLETYKRVKIDKGQWLFRRLK